MPQKKPDGRAGKAKEADDSTLAQDHQKHLDILTSLGKFTGIVDRKGRLQFASEAPLKALGYAEEDILRKPFWEAEWFSPSRESQKTVKDSISGALGGKSVECHVQTFAKDGTSIPVTFNISPLKGPEGDIISIVAETEPLAEKDADTREEHRPEASHERLDSLLTLLQEGYFETDTSDVLTAVSPSSAVILGYGSLDEMIGQRMANFWANPEERDRFLVELSGKGDGIRISSRLP